MKRNSEYSVRPVIRYVVTHWQDGTTDEGLPFGSCGPVGEFDNLAHAEQAAKALAASDAGSKYGGVKGHPVGIN